MHRKKLCVCQKIAFRRSETRIWIWSLSFRNQSLICEVWNLIKYQKPMPHFQVGLFSAVLSRSLAKQAPPSLTLFSKTNSETKNDRDGTFAFQDLFRGSLQGPPRLEVLYDDKQTKTRGTVRWQTVEHVETRSQLCVARSSVNWHRRAGVIKHCVRWHVEKMHELWMYSWIRFSGLHAPSLFFPTSPHLHSPSLKRMLASY